MKSFAAGNDNAGVGYALLELLNHAQPSFHNIGGCAAKVAVVVMLEADGPADLQEQLEKILKVIPGKNVCTILPSSRANFGAEGQALTPRLGQILDFVCAGLTNKEIARRLGLSHYTVRNHMTTLLARYGATGRKELVQKCYGRTDGGESCRH